MAANGQATLAGIERLLKSLIVAELKEICRKENLQISGVKAQLQQRIMAHVNGRITVGDNHGIERIAALVQHHGRTPPPPQTQYNHTNGFAHNRTTTMSPATAPSYNRPSLPPISNMRPYGSTQRLSFKPSAFYHIDTALTPIIDLPEYPSNRNTITSQIILTESVCERLRADSSLRVMLYCATNSISATYTSTDVDVAFPNQIEVRVNQDEVKSNYKGLKNKPGTTKPADLTQYLRKSPPRYANNLQIIYALTSKKFSVVVNLVRKRSADELTGQLKRGKVITKDQVLREMISKANDPDIVATSVNMSLKDPISTLRLGLPCRSSICNHSQCFDASYFMQLQEQAPTWTCPVCSKSISYEALAIDQYVQDILDRTSKATDQVTIEPDGQWHEINQGDVGSRGKQSRAAYDRDDDSDDEIIEVTDNRMNKIKTEAAPATPALAQQTPPLSSREASMSNASTSRMSNGGNHGNKRQNAVIDLTLSDDDEPPRPAKRQNTQSVQSGSYTTPTSIPDSRNYNTANQPASIYGQGNQQAPRNHFSPAMAPPPGPGMPGLGPLEWPNRTAYSSFPSRTDWRQQNGSHHTNSSSPS